ncbi:type 11 methyltransferase [Oceanibaculum indicum P24]|uniref:Type 11 methyltransferase n=1 Tax=Oceanibaculum indicum P24 TaxID=1207063 RepID=K2IQ64_9PROT|nr:type 11 methyltransferase [Oceanibaculum indicum P24]
MIPVLRPLPEEAPEEGWRDTRRQLAQLLPEIPPIGLGTALRGDLGVLYRQVAARNLRALPDPGDPLPAFPEPGDPRFWPGLLGQLLYDWPHRCLPDIEALEDCPPPLLEAVVHTLLETGLPLDTDDAETARREAWYASLIGWIEATVSADPAGYRARLLLRAFQSGCNFLAHFRGRTDRETLARRGRLIAHLAGASGPCRPPRRSGRIRLGFLILNAGNRTETRVLLPFLTGLNRARIEGFLILIHGIRTDAARANAACAERIIDLSGVPEAERADYIRGFDLDILVFANNLLGRAGEYPRLACQRLARRQVATIASPASTGLPGIDRFLTSADAESGDISGRYSEKPLLMEGLPVCFAEPPLPAHRPPESHLIDLQVAELRRAVPGPATLLLATAHAAKLNPALRDCWLSILERAPETVLLLLPGNPGWTVPVESRAVLRWMREAATARGLDARRIAVAGPFQDRAALVHLARRADIFLDSFPYAGCASLIDPLRAGTPVVALEGAAQKERQGAALLRSIALDALVAGDPIAYADIAVALAGDASAREHWRSRILSRIEAAPFLDPADFGRRAAACWEILFREIMEQEAQADPLAAETLRGDMRSQGFGRGWHAPEAGGWRWSIGGEAAQLSLPVPFAGPAMLELALRHLPDGARGGLRVEVGGRPVPHRLLPAPDPAEAALLRATIPEALLVGGTAEIALQAPPQHAKGDPRPLGVALARFALQPAAGTIRIDAAKPLLATGWEIADGLFRLTPGRTGTLFPRTPLAGWHLLVLEGLQAQAPPRLTAGGQEIAVRDGIAYLPPCDRLALTAAFGLTLKAFTLSPVAL